MSDKEKIEALKKKALHENEEKYGKETRTKYGDESIDASDKKMMNLAEEEWNRWKYLEEEILARLEVAVKEGLSADTEEAEEIVMLHKEWLMFSIANYSKEMHKGIAVMYVADERFKNYYDRNVEGCANLLYEAVKNWI